jgi:hypothetical protein
MEVLVVAWILSAIIAGAGAYFGAYLRQKGQNVATREDIERLTHATEEIKAQIGGDLWEQQRRWEFKVGAYRRLLEHINDAASAFRHLEVIDAAQQVRKAKGAPPDVELVTAEKEFDTRVDLAFNGIRTAAVFAPVFVGDTAKVALQTLVSEWAQAQAEERDYIKFAKRLRQTLIRSGKVLAEAAREDLKLGSTSGSSTA